MRVFLVRVRETTHATHDAEDIVVDGVDVEGLVSPGSIGDALDRELGIVDAGHIAGARRLVLSRLETERVHVDRRGGGRDVRHVLVRLDEREVRAVARGETLVTVEFETASAVSLEGKILVGRRIFDSPDKALHRVVEVEFGFVFRARLEDFAAGVLELLNKVLVRDLGEAAALVRVEVDVIDEKARVRFHINLLHNTLTGRPFE